MGSVVLDTNVLIGAMDPQDDLHTVARRHLGEWIGPDHERLMPTLAYAELMVHPARAGLQRLADESLRRLDVRLIDLTPTIARQSAAIRARFDAVALGDAVVLATALEHGSSLLTFDAQMNVAWDRLP